MTIDAGRAALADGRWAEARTIVERLVAAEESPTTLEGLGVAARWLNDQDTAVDVHERAYRLYRDAGDDQGAARMTLQLAIHAYRFRSDLAVARGWVQRARRLLRDVPQATAEAGQVRLIEAHLALLVDHDLEAGLRLAREASAIGRAAPSLDVEMFGLATELVERYLRRLDPGEITERVGPLAILMRARCPVGDRGARALAAIADGMVAQTHGDHGAARCNFEDAVDLLTNGDPYELAQARRRLAGSLAALGRHDPARERRRRPLSGSSPHRRPPARRRIPPASPHESGRCWVCWPWDSRTTTSREAWC